MQALKSLFKNTGANQARKIALWLVVCLSLTLIALLIPTFFIQLQTDTHSIKKKLNTYFAKSNLSITYDDIDISFFKGIVIYQFEIALDSEQNQKIFTAADLSVNISWYDYLKEEKVHIKNISSNTSQWHLRFNQDGLDTQTLERLNTWLAKQGDFSMRFSNAAITFDLTSDIYNKTRYNLKTANIGLQKKDRQLGLQFEHSSGFWGYTDIQFQSTGCKDAKECDWFLGKYNIELNNFPAKKLSWLSNEYSLKKGEIDSRLTIEHSEKGLSLRGKIEAEKIKVHADKELLFKELYFTIEPTLIIDKKQNKLDLVGTYFDIPFSLKYVKSQKAIWPEFLSISLNPTENQVVPLDFSFAISGLKSASFSLDEGKKSSSYRQFDSAIVINKGALLKDKQKVFDINLFDLKIEKNKYQLSNTIQYGQSDLAVNLKGTVETKKKSFTPILDRYNENYRSDDKIKIIRFKFNSRGNLQSQQLHWQDLQTIISHIANIYETELKLDLEKGWIKPRLMQRQWYQKFIQQNWLDAKVNINKFNWGKETFENLKGELSLGYPKLDLLVENKANDTDNYFNFIWSYPGNEPYVRLEYDVTLVKARDLAQAWLPADLITSMSSIRAKYTGKTRGERLIDWHKHKKFRSTFILNDAQFTNKIKRYSNKPWQKIKIDLKKDGTRGSIAIAARADKERIQFKGKVLEEDLNSKIHFDKKVN